MFFERRCVVCDDPDGPVCVVCERSFVRRPETSLARGAFVLDDRLRPVLVALKYRRERRLADWAGAMVAPLVPRGADVICWVPATPERLKWRGYDQAAEIARAVGRRTRVPVKGLLTRANGDQRQTGQSRSERSAGPDLTARCPTSDLVVLIDDVVTTGATLGRATQALRAAGTERVVPVVLAAAPLRTPLGLSS